MYIHVKSNHPPQVIKNVPLGINRRLCSASCNEQAFDDAKPAYQDALEATGHVCWNQRQCNNTPVNSNSREEEE